MGFGQFMGDVFAGRGLQSAQKEAKRLGKKAAPGINEGFRLGLKATGAVSRIGHKVSDVANVVQPFVGAVPLLGNAVSAVGTGAGMIAGAADTANRAIGMGQNIVRSGRGFLEAGSAGDVMATARDIQRQSKSAGQTIGQLQGQVKSMGSKLQRTR